MKATQTFFVDLARLHRAGPEAITVIRLMMAANDIALANLGLRYFKKEQPRLRKHIQLGACRYFIRLQCGHLHEALKLVDEVRNNSTLLGLVQRCPDYSRSSFQRLVHCLPGGVEDEKFEKYVSKIRHNLVFHYQPKPVEGALRDRAAREEARRSTVTRGTDISLWRFGIADDIEDSIVCRQLWEIPRNLGLRAEADRISDFGSSLCRDFLDFSGELAFRFVKEHATI